MMNLIKKNKKFILKICTCLLIVSAIYPFQIRKYKRYKQNISVVNDILKRNEDNLEYMCDKLITLEKKSVCDLDQKCMKSEINQIYKNQDIKLKLMRIKEDKNKLLQYRKKLKDSPYFYINNNVQKYLEIVDNYIELENIIINPSDDFSKQIIERRVIIKYLYNKRNNS